MVPRLGVWAVAVVEAGWAFGGVRGDADVASDGAECGVGWENAITTPASPLSCTQESSKKQYAPKP